MQKKWSIYCLALVTILGCVQSPTAPQRDESASLSILGLHWFPSSNPAQHPDPAVRHYFELTVNGRSAVQDVVVDTMRWAFSNFSADGWDGFTAVLRSKNFERLPSALESIYFDLHNCQYLEMEVYSSIQQENAISLNVDLGTCSEDSNGNGHLNFENDGKLYLEKYDCGIVNYLTDPSAIPPKYEIDPSGASGIYAMIAPAGYWGSGNGRLDTEDMDRDGTLDTIESYYEYEVSLNQGWSTVKIDLKDFARAMGDIPPISNTNSANFLMHTPHIRIWAANNTSEVINGYIEFKSIQFIE